MRVASYLVDGRPAWGLVTANGEVLVDATSVHPTLKAALAAGGRGDLTRRLTGRPAGRRVAHIRLLPVDTGRATGRESVCHTVYIAVLAGELKQNTTVQSRRYPYH